MSFYTGAFYISLSICISGIMFRAGTWFLTRIRPEKQSIFSQIKEMLKTVLSKISFAGIFWVIKRFFANVLLQFHIFQHDRLGWLMHIFIFYGFTFLLFMHALDQYFTIRFFPEYVSTLNPFMFLRNLSGIMVAAGIGIAVFRRLSLKGIKQTNNKEDWTALLILFIIIFSGFVLEASQIMSASIFDQMTADYGGTDDEEEIAGLKAVWARDFGVIFPEEVDIKNPELMESGTAFHEESCAVCHVKPDAAFISYPLSRLFVPGAWFMDRLRIDVILWYFHIIVCFAGLAYLPFGKFFHIITTPLNLLAGHEKNETEIKLAMSMDSCTHCGICSQYCSVAPVYKILGNPDILPSEKLNSLRHTGSQLHKSKFRMNQLSYGSFICTECGKCTDICPSGINLQYIWQESKKELMRQGYNAPHIHMQAKKASEWEKILQKSEQAHTSSQFHLNLTDRPETFWDCVQCTICTNVCPVVAASDDPESDLDLTPQQIMNFMRLQMKDMALGARMVWDCVTCYMCQEQCPQGVRVADVLYELRNIACERLSTQEIKDEK
ncbi:4Fe-4S ferredoxin iron-sulfur binding domain-containing protein [Desulfonema limicola]|uniref:4Fe-4S ferredoxin iron-sulfur binding domain-containing protein n=1 Tax=Desulfonema limicola TaxID=45656 RepID=A0A975B8Y0_9BACT|nr:4Fe-4S dicluster domain-containing protein [Desulfonema limicola]QTA80934.1 4Fe-4S ferredoxin iron-sulfur binding domain-containing protein [Desulfonema limicola]